MTYYRKSNPKRETDSEKYIASFNLPDMPRQSSAMYFLIISLISFMVYPVNFAEAHNISVNITITNDTIDPGTGYVENLFEMMNNEYYQNKEIFNISMNYEIYSYTDYELNGSSQKSETALHLLKYYNFQDGNNKKIEKSGKVDIKNFKYKKSSGTGSFYFDNETKYLICYNLTISKQEAKSYLAGCKNLSIDENIKFILDNPSEKKRQYCDFYPEITVNDYYPLKNMSSIRKIQYYVIPRYNLYPGTMAESMAENANGNMNGNMNGTAGNADAGNNANYTQVLNETSLKKIISQENFRIEYWIEDIYGNIIRSRAITSSRSKKEFTIRDNSPSTLIIRARMKNVSCDDFDNTNDEAVFPIILKPNIIFSNEYQIMDITQIGNTIFLKATFTKNSTDKNEIRVWLENGRKKISNIQEISMYSKNSELSLTIPIEIASMTNYPDSSRLVIDLFGIRTETVIPIRGENIKDNIITSKNAAGIINLTNLTGFTSPASSKNITNKVSSNYSIKTISVEDDSENTVMTDRRIISERYTENSGNPKDCLEDNPFLKYISMKQLPGQFLNETENIINSPNVNNLSEWTL